MLTKVRPPQRRKDVLRRLRLIDVLHQNLHRKLTFVSAPAGYGKTTLLVDFASDVDALVFWYRIGLGDNDLVQFVRHLLASFQQQVPDFGSAMEEKLNTLGGSPDAASLAIDFINEIESKVGDFSLLVLDDYHLAGENQQIVDFVENLLEHLPDRLRILIGSRSVYGIPTASLYIRDELVTISPDELRFRADELQKLVLQNHHVRLSNEQAEEFAKRADGWIVAILLALRTMENGVLPSLTGGTEHIYKYLAEEVVSRLSEDLRDFMLVTSTLGDFNEALCNYVLEREDAASFLRALEERNLFVSRTETNEGPSYRYHQLFAEFLQDYFAQQQPQRLAALHARAAEWHRVRDDWEHAIQHKLASGERQQAARWMDEVAVDFYTSGRQMLLNRWVDDLKKPPDQRKEAPHLLLYQAKMLGNQSAYPAALKLLEMAEPILAGLGDTDAQANAIITRGMIFRLTGKYKPAHQLAEKAQGLLPANSKKEETRQKWLQAERLKAIPLYQAGKPDEAVASLEAAADGLRGLAASGDPARRTQYSYDLAECLNDLGLVQLSLGRMLDAQRAFQETLDIHLENRSNLGALASARNNIGYLHHQVGEFALAWREYSLALEHAKAAGLVRWQIGILNGRAELLLDVDEADDARANLEQALSLAQSEELPELIGTYIAMARLERKEGKYNEAMKWLRKAASFASGGLDENEYLTELGYVYAEMDQAQLALEQFKKVLTGWPKRQLPKQAQVLAAFLAARTSLQAGAQREAEKFLHQALEGAARLGYDQFLVPVLRFNPDFALFISKHGAPGQAQGLLDRLANFATGKATLESKSVEQEVEPAFLEAKAFGPGEVRRNGELIPASLWRSTRARALFFYILDKGSVRKETIGLEFWPDFSSGKISSNFHATLWRVRQALGLKESIVFENEQYVLHPALQVWYDVAEFEDQLERAAQADLSRRERVEMLKQALDLYAEHYLPDIYMEWADRRREELRRRYLDTLIELAALEVENRQYRDAQALFEKVLGIDPYRDEVHLSLMRCLALSGSPSAAIAHFKKYRALLRQELNAEPLPELQAYYQELAVKV
ncbi:MAG: hypothetical protein KIS85_06900 [Anaerolineales bacterium]|nr:hypothetical protein [Anaerolineales bacterium]